MKLLTHSAEETIAQGRALASRLQAPILILLSGELGAGKTTLAKGIISGLGAAREEDVTSPTFTLVHSFHNPATGVLVHHVDLYRIGDARDLGTLGLEDAFSEAAVVLVEWPDRLRLRTDWPVLRIRLSQDDDDNHLIEIVGEDVYRDGGGQGRYNGPGGE